MEPSAVGVTIPIPLLIEIDVALSVFHARFEEPPTVMVEGVAVRNTHSAAGDGGGGVTTTDA